MRKDKNKSSQESDRKHLKEVVKNLPFTCGVYIMKSKEGDVLYVGKAASLRKRVASYFSRQVSLKTGLLVSHIADIDYIECESQEQALILEAALIKEKKPKYNISLRDDKSYPYVEITNEEFPRIYITRKRINKNSTFLGPYPQTNVVRSALNTLRRIFPYCSCRCFKKSECLFAHLKLCPAPCTGKILPQGYRENIKAIIKVFKGEREELVESLHNRMQKFSDENKFEEAAEIRDKLNALINLYQGSNLTHELTSLKEVLHLPSTPLYIEAMDISSLSGRHATGSVVVFRNAVADKNSYRRYRIKKVSGIDDYACIAEITQRRYARLCSEKRKMPDLLIIDGGIGHVQTAKKELDKLNLKIPVIGIAKRNEEVWFPESKSPLVISKSSPCLHLIQRIRDEAHRFARKYHLLLRKKKLVESRG
ncbi:MAG: excinuclease ABC subunit UvrC [Candidatus Omnitrophota bacterium]